MLFHNEISLRKLDLVKKLPPYKFEITYSYVI